MNPIDRPVPLHAGLARIAGYSAAITAETDRLLSLPPAEQEAGSTVTAVLSEMRAMSQLLIESRAEIVAMAPPSQSGAALQEAGDALDIVVTETERATFEIMNQAERAQAAAIRLHDGTSTEITAGLAEVNEATTAIVLACIFQDITGQRIRKVVDALRQLETRLSRFATAVKARDEAGIDPAEMERRMRDELLILNGPQLKGPATPQDAIDALFD